MEVTVFYYMLYLCLNGQKDTVELEKEYILQNQSSSPPDILIKLNSTLHD